MGAVTADITAWGNTVHSMAGPLAEELVRVTKRVLASGCEFSLQELRKAGLSEAAAQCTIVIEFGTDACAFDAVAPEGFVIHGAWKPSATLDEHLIDALAYSAGMACATPGPLLMLNLCAKEL